MGGGGKAELTRTQGQSWNRVTHLFLTENNALHWARAAAKGVSRTFSNVQWHRFHTDKRAPVALDHSLGGLWTHMKPLTVTHSEGTHNCMQLIHRLLFFFCYKAEQNPSSPLSSVMYETQNKGFIVLQFENSFFTCKTMQKKVTIKNRNNSITAFQKIHICVRNFLFSQLFRPLINPLFGQL